MKFIFAVIFLSTVFYIFSEVKECKSERGPKISDDIMRIKELSRTTNVSEPAKRQGRTPKLNKDYVQKESIPVPNNIRQKPFVVSIDQLSKFQKQYLPMTVTFKEYMTLADWFHLYDLNFRLQLTQLLNRCQVLQKPYVEFSPDDIVHISNSPYIYQGHLSVCILILDPISIGKDDFIPGTTFYECFIGDLFIFGKELNLSVLSLHVGYHSTESVSIQEPQEPIITFIIGAATVFMSILAGTCIGYVLFQMRRCCCQTKEKSVQLRKESAAIREHNENRRTSICGSRLLRGKDYISKDQKLMTKCQSENKAKCPVTNQARTQAVIEVEPEIQVSEL